jgi:hypothetical protein
MINAVVEGASDEGVARAVIEAAGRRVGKVIVKNGKTRLDPDVHRYNQAALRSPWVVFRDSDTACPVDLRSRLMAQVQQVSPSFLMRIVHPMSEGWLLADRRGFAKFFHVRSSDIPRDPEALTNPKEAVLRLCARSRLRGIRSDMVASGGRTGRLYVVQMNAFATTAWNVGEASENSDSLRRAVERIRDLPSRGRDV